MKRLTLLLVLVSLASCSTMSERQRTTFKRVLITSLVLSAAGAVLDHGSSDRRIPTPADPCAKLGPESCR